jgi:hypothetical protein
MNTTYFNLPFDWVQSPSMGSRQFSRLLVA